MTGEAGKQLFAHWELIDKLAGRRFRDNNIALEAAQFVLEKLGENEWERVRQLRDQGALRAYLASVIRRLLEDFARSRFGRRARVPEWIRSLGFLWEKIYRLLCLEGHSRQDVLEILRDSAPGGRDDHVIRDAVSVIRRKVPDCGHPTEPGERTGLDAGHATVRAQEQVSSDDSTRMEIIASIYNALLQPDEPPPAADIAGELEAIERLRQLLNLSSEERLILRMVYEDGLKVTEAGRLLGIGSHAIHGRLRRLMTRIRQACEAAGVEGLLDNQPRV